MNSACSIRCPATAGRGFQRGLSLVEMLVGIAIGLFIVAAAAVLVSSQLSDNRRLLLDTQIQQDLRATADIITRDIRRSGYNENALTALWRADRPNVVPAVNSFTLFNFASPSQPSYRYARQSETQFSLKLENNTIYRRIGVGTWQPLTDSNTLKVNVFSVTQFLPAVAAVPMACPQLCPTATPGVFDQACWPTLQVRDVLIVIEGQATSDARVVRNIASRVRLRNDDVVFNAPGAKVCP